MRRCLVGLVALGGLAWGGDAFAAKKFQGMIEYKFEITGENAGIAALMLPTAVKVHVRGNDTRVELSGGMLAAMAPVVIRKAKAKKTYTISEAESKVTVADDVPTDLAASPQAEKLPDVETIDGYECHKYGIRQADGSVALMWTTDALELPPLATTGGNMPLLAQAGVPGLVMRVMVSQEGMTVKLEAVDVDLTKPAKSLFVIPKVYDVVQAEAP